MGCEPETSAPVQVDAHHGRAAGGGDARRRFEHAGLELAASDRAGEQAARGGDEAGPRLAGGRAPGRDDERERRSRLPGLAFDYRI